MDRQTLQTIASADTMVGAVIDGVCEARAAGRTGAALARAASAQFPSGASGANSQFPVPGGPPAPPTPSPAPTPMPQPQPIPPDCTNGACAILPTGLLPSFGYCGVYTDQIQRCFKTKCQRVCDPCWLQVLDQSIIRQSWPMVRNQLGRTFLKFGPSGYVEASQPVPDPESSSTTNFVAGPLIIPGNSVLFQQPSKWTLPWRPGCLKLTLGFSGGSMEENMTHIQVKVFVMRRGADMSGQLYSFAFEWNPDEFYTGDQFRCGDSCASVNVIGTLGCGGIEHVGDDAELLIQVYNDATATNNVTVSNLTITFDGLKTACCDDCYKGKSCGCSGK